MTMPDPNKKDERQNWGTKFFNPADGEAEKAAWDQRTIISAMKNPMDRDVLELLSLIRELGFPVVEYSVNEVEGVAALVVGRRIHD